LAPTSSADEPVASFTHDLGPGRTLHGYRAEPASDKRQMDRVHEHMYGFRTESPRTPYICVWRDPVRFSATEADGPPVQILMACSFGTSAWSPPGNIMEEAKLRMHRQEAGLRADWVKDGDGYRLTRIEFEVRGPDFPKRFRSANAGADLGELRFRDFKVSFPRSVGDRLSFRIEATAPYRLNSGEPSRDPVATLAVEGSALPIPAWLMY